MQKLRPDLDVINDILLAVLEAMPNSEFTQSLYNQYQERGSLSKKQLEGLYSKAAEIKGISVSKLSTLEARILKMPNKAAKVPLPQPDAPFKRDEAVGEMIDKVLGKYPEHKRVLFYKARYENNETLTPNEVLELQRFAKLVK